ncbi:hypothetical protein GALL_58020 [mine drainage metagenome]|uniref:Uncharacterized protein n=1 Tax=mine drainage metagenome TaxID=410659 RepID=A0A1J5SW81_9ZZZZ
MAEEKKLTEQESLQLITEMIHKVKSSFHESGTSAILWGSVIGFCGLFSFLQIQFDFSTGGFDVWLLTFIALVPQVVITIRESRQKRVLTYEETAMNAIWIVFAISIFALVFYNNAVPRIAENYFAKEGIELFEKNITTGEITTFHPYILSVSSVFLILYAVPTLATGLARKFKPMIIGGIICYLLFLVSCFTTYKYDMLLHAIAGIINWLIPGLILRRNFLKGKTVNV